MFCGFGAVVLFYLIINHSTALDTPEEEPDLMAEALLLEEEVLIGKRNLVRIQDRLEKISDDNEVMQRMTDQLVEEVARNRDSLAKQTELTLARRESLEKLKADIQSIEEENKRLEGAISEDSESGNSVRAFLGDGDRQYLTGMKVGGEHILILLDASASMLDETIVNIIRRRNLPTEQKLQAAKWQRALATVDWLMTQIPVDSRYQVFSFNVKAASLLEGSDSVWLEAENGDELNDVATSLYELVPENGTSLYNAIEVANNLDPPPDNIYLLTDGLPTQGESPPLTRKTVTERTRLRHFGKAIQRLPNGVPVNVVLFPMEGDPKASGTFWNFAHATGGTMLSPARDWP
ncbi:MAG: VWA domain-containing protein [Pseudomonadota bacterium]